MEHSKVIEAAGRQALASAAGVVLGARTRQIVTPLAGSRGASAVQIGSAVGAAAASGAGVSGSLGAGAALVATKVAAGVAASTVAAPFVLGGLALAGLGYGLVKLLDD